VKVPIDRDREYANVLKCLASAMDLMPNLHTIQIICEGSHYTRCSRVRQRYFDTIQFLTPFERHRYPSVRRAILHVRARYILASLPAVVDVYINSGKHLSDRLSEFATTLAAYCPVESLGWKDYPGTSMTGTGMLFIAVPILYRVQWQNSFPTFVGLSAILQSTTW